MRVKQRSTANGMFNDRIMMEVSNNKDVNLSGNMVPSAVGSFAIQLYRRDPATGGDASSIDNDASATPPASDTDMIVPSRAPTFEDLAEWSHCNTNTVSKVSSPFEIE